MNRDGSAVGLIVAGDRLLPDGRAKGLNERLRQRRLARSRPALPWVGSRECTIQNSGPPMAFRHPRAPYCISPWKTSFNRSLPFPWEGVNY